MKKATALLFVLVLWQATAVSGAISSFLAETQLEQAEEGINQEEKRLGSPLGEYKLKFVQATGDGFLLSLQYSGTASFYVNSSSPIVQNLAVLLVNQTYEVFRVKIYDQDHQRWEIPESDPFPNDAGSFSTIESIDRVLYDYKWSSSPFSLQVLRKSTGQVIFDTSAGALIISDLYIQLSTFLPSSIISGLGERHGNFFFEDGVFSIWNKDQYACMNDNKAGTQTYGWHPMYLTKETKSSSWDVVFLRNSNAMDIEISTPSSRETRNITFRVAGGIFDFKFFLGNDEWPETPIKMYHEYIGGWELIPFWAMGYHQCRWGYTDSATFIDLAKNFSLYDIPVDVLWTDIDYMVDFIDFTLNENYNITQLKDLHTHWGLHFVLIVDAGVAVNKWEDNPGLSLGTQMNVFLVDDLNETEYFVGKVWPGPAHFVDFMHPNATEFWSESLEVLYNLTFFDGVWLDMNENSNFCNGHCSSQDNSKYTWLPYTPTNAVLYEKTMTLTLAHYDGNIEFNTHNIYNGFLESVATHSYLKNYRGQEQPFLLSRANAVGTGKFSAHWTGDNYASESFMSVSIPTIMLHAMFGNPFVGADICGFAGNTTEPLCALWMQLGMWYPFARNHNSNDTISQEPWAFGEELLNVSRASIKLRYSLLKHLYGLWVQKMGTGVVFQPLFFRFPFDSGLFDSDVLNSQFMLGNEIMVAPILKVNSTKRAVYFPDIDWFDLTTGDCIHKAGESQAIIVNSQSQTALAFLAEGKLIGFQDVEKRSIGRSWELDNTFQIKSALSSAKDWPGNKLSSNGTIMACANASDYNILKKCLVGNCMMSVSITANKWPWSSYFDVLVKFEPETPASVLDSFYVSGVDFYGWPSSSLEGELVKSTLSYEFPEKQLISGKTTLRLQCTSSCTLVDSKE